jgi:hypothetical protein
METFIRLHHWAILMVFLGNNVKGRYNNCENMYTKDVCLLVIGQISNIIRLNIFTLELFFFDRPASVIL